MPDSGFFDKFRGEDWPLKRWEGRSRNLDSRVIFREELAAVYEHYNAPVRVHVLIDGKHPHGEKMEGRLGLA